MAGAGTRLGHNRLIGRSVETTPISGGPDRPGIDGPVVQRVRVFVNEPLDARRLVPPLGRWRRFDPARAALMKAALERIVATPGMSKDVLEQASKSLA